LGREENDRLEKQFYEALRLAEKAHKGQTRWEGAPYIVHPRRVAMAVGGWMAKIVAVLHDVVEDSDTTLDEIRSQFGDIVADAVDSVTHRDGESYLDFILRARQNTLGRMVKIADINDNLSDIDEFKGTKNSKEKYILARYILELPVIRTTLEPDDYDYTLRHPLEPMDTHLDCVATDKCKVSLSVKLDNPTKDGSL
jgi:hypothetical protein